MNNFPECEKVRKVQPFSQKIGEFLEFLEEEGIYLAARTNNSLDLVRTSKMELLARFFEIDLDKVEQEKKQILDRIVRKDHGNSV